jgi:hypothetical protein
MTGVFAYNFLWCWVPVWRLLAPRITENFLSHGFRMTKHRFAVRAGSYHQNPRDRPDSSKDLLVWSLEIYRKNRVYRAHVAGEPVVRDVAAGHEIEDFFGRVRIIAMNIYNTWTVA